MATQDNNMGHEMPFDAGAKVPDELRPITAAVDELAQAERDAAPAMLEQRVYLATREAIAREAGRAGHGRVVVRRVGFAGRLRIAAGIALVGGLSAVWLGQVASPRPGSGLISRGETSGEPARLEQEVEWLLAMRNSGIGLDGMSDAIDLLQLDADVISDSLQPEWPSGLDEGTIR